MQSLQKKEVLRQLPLFRGLTGTEIEIISQIAEERSYPAHHIFIRQDEVTKDVYFLLSGAAKVYRLTEEGKEISLTIRGEGEIVGEMSLLDNSPRSATVETIQETKVLFLPAHAFMQILRAHPDIAIHLLQTLTERIRENVALAESLISKSLEERTLQTLRVLASHFPGQEITLSQEELSLIVGATRARVSEVLQILQNQGKITIEHRKLRLL